MEQLSRGVPPPRELRAVVLAAALARRPAGYPDPEALPRAATPYAAEVDKLEALLREVTVAQWRAPVAAAAGTVRGLVDHLAGNDAALAAALGVEVPDSGRDGPPHAVWRAWAQALLRHALTSQLTSPLTSPLGGPLTSPRTGPLGGPLTGPLPGPLPGPLAGPLTGPLTARVEVAALPMAAGSAYLARAFETWIHADDIRGALGRPPRPPEPRHLAPMADLHVRSLPAALALTGRAHPGRTAAVRLTGPGGDSWRIPLAPGSPVGEPDVTVTADVLDYCHAAANRRDPGTLPRTVHGDRALAEDLLAVLGTFAHD